MKKSMIVFLAALVIVFIGCVKELEKEGICETTKLIGRVIEESTQNPVAGVKVSVTNGSRTYTSCITEGDGNFELQVNFDKIDKDYYLLMDGGTAAKTKKNELHGMGMEVYDYTNVFLYNAQETDGLSVSSLEITSITASSAVCKAEIIAGTDVHVTKRGICWSSSNENPTTSNHAMDNGSGAGYYTGEISGLAENTTYYIRAYAQTTDTIAYSNPKSFKTYALPSVTTNLVLNITAVSAECGGDVLSNGGLPIIGRGICWNTFSNPTIDNSCKYDENNSLGAFSCSMNDLNENTTYYVRAFARNSSGISYGEERSLKTENVNLPTFQCNGNTYYVAPDPGNGMLYSTANSYCDNLTLFGLSDWKLPTEDELIQMYNNRNTIGGFASLEYWTRTSINTWGDNYCHRLIDFADGSLDCWWTNTVGHDDPCPYSRVRPIRRKN